MGFLNWWGENKTNQEDSQLDLFGGSQPLKRQRVDGAVINKDFNAAIKQAGGSEDAHQEAAEALTGELFDMPSKDLYKAVGGKPGDRSSLPKEAQKLFMAGELRATADLQSTEIYSVGNFGDVFERETFGFTFKNIPPLSNARFTALTKTTSTVRS